MRTGTPSRVLATLSLLVGGALLLGNGCKQATGDEDPIPRVTVDGDNLPRGTYKVVSHTSADGASDAEEKAFKKTTAGPARRTIFINGKGGTFKGGYDDSSANRSSIVGGTASVPAYEKGAGSWSNLMTCVRDQFARFNVDITDVDPGSKQHIECVVGGRPGHVGMGSGVGGVSPMNDDCSVVERAVVYVFSQQFSSAQVECEVAAQEIGHALGMDHAYLCADPMTYLNGCGKKSFQDKDAYCGEGSARACMCGGSRQNSVKHLTRVLGAAETPLPPDPDGGAPPPPPPSDGGAPPPPSDGGAPPPPDDSGAPPPPGDDKTGPAIASLTPADGATLSANTTISISASITDPSGVGKAILRWTVGGKTADLGCDEFLGEVTCTASGSTYTWRVPVGSGARNWSIRAIDKKGNESSSATRALTLGGSVPPPPPPPGTGPTISFAEPTSGANHTRGDHIHVRVNVADDGSVASVRLLWRSPSGDVPYTMESLGGSTWGIDLDVSWSAIVGPRTLVITAKDDAGNEGKEERTINITP